MRICDELAKMASPDQGQAPRSAIPYRNCHGRVRGFESLHPLQFSNSNSITCHLVTAGRYAYTDATAPDCNQRVRDRCIPMTGGGSTCSCARHANRSRSTSCAVGSNRPVSRRTRRVISHNSMPISGSSNVCAEPPVRTGVRW